MNREIVTRQLSSAELRQELAFVVGAWPQEEAHCFVLFGFAWGNDFYPGNKWYDLVLNPGNVLAEIEEVEQRGLGCIGSDDLFLSAESNAFEFRFCHESDIHLRYGEPSEMTEAMFKRWVRNGLRPREWEVGADTKDPILIRGEAPAHHGTPADGQASAPFPLQPGCG